jgi:hypothetical protein
VLAWRLQNLCKLCNFETKHRQNKPPNNFAKSLHTFLAILVVFGTNIGIPKQGDHMAKDDRKTFRLRPNIHNLVEIESAKENLSKTAWLEKLVIARKQLDEERKQLNVELQKVLELQKIFGEKIASQENEKMSEQIMNIEKMTKVVFTILAKNDIRGALNLYDAEVQELKQKGVLKRQSTI